jgi:hypothetical protein
VVPPCAAQERAGTAIKVRNEKTATEAIPDRFNEVLIGSMQVSVASRNHETPHPNRFLPGPAMRTRPSCPYPQQARFTVSVSVIGGVPIATNHADLTSDKVSMHRGEAAGAGGRARSRVTADAIRQ